MGLFEGGAVRRRAASVSRPLAFGPAVALVLLAMPGAASADTVLEAERMAASPSRAGGKLAVKTASKGAVLRLSAGGRARRRLSISHPVERIVVRARRRSCAGALTVTVDGRRLLRRVVGTRRLVAYSAARRLPAGRHTIALSVAPRRAHRRCRGGVLVDSVRLVRARSSTRSPAGTTTTPGGAAPGTGTASPDGAPAPAIGLPDGYRLVWRDEFGGPFNGGLWYRYSGSGTNGVGQRRPENVSTGDGELRIAGQGSTVGGLGSGATWIYGIFEIRSRTDPGPAYTNAWILWPADNVWPDHTEIDISEHPMGDRTNSRTAIHYGADHRIAWANNPGDYTQWHTWTVVWTADSLVFYLDGRHYLTQTVGVPSTPHRWALQLDVGPAPDWLPAPSGDASTTARVDYVRVWQQR